MFFNLKNRTECLFFLPTHDSINWEVFFEVLIAIWQLRTWTSDLQGWVKFFELKVKNFVYLLGSGWEKLLSFDFPAVVKGIFEIKIASVISDLKMEDIETIIENEDEDIEEIIAQFEFSP